MEQALLLCIQEVVGSNPSGSIRNDGADRENADFYDQKERLISIETKRAISRQRMQLILFAPMNWLTIFKIGSTIANFPGTPIALWNFGGTSTKN